MKRPKAILNSIACALAILATQSVFANTEPRAEQIIKSVRQAIESELSSTSYVKASYCATNGTHRLIAGLFYQDSTSVVPVKIIAQMDSNNFGQIPMQIVTKENAFKWDQPNHYFDHSQFVVTSKDRLLSLRFFVPDKTELTTQLGWGIMMDKRGDLNARCYSTLDQAEAYLKSLPNFSTKREAWD